MTTCAEDDEWCIQGELLGSMTTVQDWEVKDEVSGDHGGSEGARRPTGADRDSAPSAPAPYGPRRPDDPGPSPN